MNNTTKPPSKTIAGWFVEAIVPAIFLANSIAFATNASHKLASATGEAVLGLIVSFFSGYIAMLFVIARPLKRYFETPNQ